MYDTPSVPQYKDPNDSNSKNNTDEMTSIALILHYPPTYQPTHQPIQFCPISSSPYILVQNLNSLGPYISGRREYKSEHDKQLTKFIDKI
jgi:hypothetical protein